MAGALHQAVDDVDRASSERSAASTPRNVFARANSNIAASA